jgi:hypothetical protein
MAICGSGMPREARVDLDLFERVGVALKDGPYFERDFEVLVSASEDEPVEADSFTLVIEPPLDV